MNCSRFTSVLLLIAALFASSCAGSRLRTRADAVGQSIAAARDNGAQRCAPVQLAMAESHLDFARLESDEGDYYRAKAELAIAEKNANEALRLSPKDRCTDSKPIPVVTPQDSDGDGILDPDDTCPKRPEDIDTFEDEDGCPDEDNDQDGILDTKDQCPLDPEDKDGFKDRDGCPDEDNDQDGIADTVDQCPDQPEDKDGFEDDDGCPDCDNDKDGVLECPRVVDLCPDQPAKTADGCPKKYKNVVITKKKIEIKQTIYFDTSKTKIKPVSYGILNEVSRALNDNPSIVIRIEGHTDSQGSERKNLRLSEGRAEAVLLYLRGQGVESSRLTSRGFGEDVPIADNRTRMGRKQNRRVEFVIVSR